MFKKNGFKAYAFGYSSTGKPIEENRDKLIEYVNSRPEQIVHLVAHSLGGTLSMLAMPGIKKTGKLLMLGSPINGSQVAKKLYKRKWHKFLLRYATKPLMEGVQNPSVFRPSKMIAGNLPVGVGQIVHRMKGINDGTVSVDETQANWIDEHIIIHANHMGLLKSKQAKKLTLDFLQQNSEITQ